jgi:hypothetical protein
MGAVLDTTETAEPVAVKALTEAGFGAGFTGVWLFASLCIATASYALHRSKLLPSWTAWLGYLVAALNLITSLAIFGGGNGAAIGGVNLLIGALPLVVWAASISIVMLRTPQPRKHAPSV